MIKNSRLFITGTDTGVGKTVVSLLIMKYLYNEGLSPIYIKPFQTGCTDATSEDSDAKFIYENIPQLKTSDPNQSVICCNRSPKAPLFAAQDDKTSIDFNATIHKTKKLAHNADSLIVEGAGGLLVPITKKHLLSDFITKLDLNVIIVARTGLGTINHTLLTLQACEQNGINPIGIIMIDQPETNTSQTMINENIYAIEHFSHIPVFGVISFIDNFNTDLNLYYPIIKKIFYDPM